MGRWWPRGGRVVIWKWEKAIRKSMFGGVEPMSHCTRNIFLEKREPSLFKGSILHTYDSFDREDKNRVENMKEIF